MLANPLRRRSPMDWRIGRLLQEQRNLSLHTRGHTLNVLRMLAERPATGHAPSHPSGHTHAAAHHATTHTGTHHVSQAPSHHATRPANHVNHVNRVNHAPAQTKTHEPAGMPHKGRAENAQPGPSN